MEKENIVYIIYLYSLNLYTFNLSFKKSFDPSLFNFGTVADLDAYLSNDSSLVASTYKNPPSAYSTFTKSF